MLRDQEVHINMAADIPQRPDSKSCPADDNDEPFSDASSTYWPEGWNWARLSDPEANLAALSEDEKIRMFNGLKEVLGEDGVSRLSVYRRRKYKRRQDQQLRDAGVPPPEYEAPEYLKLSRQRYSNGHHWGFVAFRTVLYDNEERWMEFKDRTQKILNIAFDHVVEDHRGHEYEEVALARKNFILHWIEDKELDGANENTLRERYRKVKEAVPAGMGFDLFLSTCSESVDSVLSGPLPDLDSPHWRDNAPFLLVVMESTEENPHGDDEEEPYDPYDPHHEKNWYQSVFKVPIEIIPNIFWPEVERAIIPPTRLTRKVKGFNHLLGGQKPREIPLIGDLNELWWGMMPSPKRLRERAMLRGFPEPTYFF